ncbi:MAG: glycosyltransferase [Anaerolineae bacterium]|nr:glycosyltransferase [Anaerolineae bacterium]
MQSSTKEIQLNLNNYSPPIFWPTVTLCMIVKDEENHLATCLESVGDLADEFIIVDTGSTDNTVEIARRFGACVKHFEWINDFAAARNESIKEAKGDWIFWMDADDRLSPDNVARLKQAAACGRADAYYCYVVSQFQNNQVVQDRIEHLRLFRNRRGVQFEFPLHEDAAPTAHRLGLTIARTNIVVSHTGYAVDSQALQAKARRNLTIIHAAHQQAPDNLYWCFHLGITLHALGDFAGSIEYLAAVIANPPPFLDRDVYLYQAYEGLMLAYAHTGQFTKVRQILAEAEQAFDYRQHFWVRAGTIYLDLDEPEQAIKALEHARTLSSDMRGQSWAAGTIEKHLSEAYLLLGNLPKARNNYLATLDETESPDPVKLRSRAQSYAAEQKWLEAKQCLASAIMLTQPYPGEWTILAKYTLQVQSSAQQARRYCYLALAQDDQNADTLNLLGLIALAQEQSSSALTHFVEALLINPQHNSARYNLNQACQLLNLLPAEVVKQYGVRVMKRSTEPSNYSLAASAFSLALEMAPKDINVYKLLAVALQNLGREEDAMLCWQTAQTII